MVSLMRNALCSTYCIRQQNAAVSTVVLRGSSSHVLLCCNISSLCWIPGILPVHQTIPSSTLLASINPNLKPYSGSLGDVELNRYSVPFTILLQQFSIFLLIIPNATLSQAEEGRRKILALTHHNAEALSRGPGEMKRHGQNCSSVLTFLRISKATNISSLFLRMDSCTLFCC